jgi:hypothetical protein
MLRSILRDHQSAQERERIRVIMGLGIIVAIILLVCIWWINRRG